MTHEERTDAILLGLLNEITSMKARLDELADEFDEQTKTLNDLHKTMARKTDTIIENQQEISQVKNRTDRRFGVLDNMLNEITRGLWQEKMLEHHGYRGITNVW